MSTKIDGSGERYTPPVSRTAPTRATVMTTAAGKPDGGSPRGDAVSLTRDAQLISETRIAAQNAPAVDQQRIDAVRQSLRDGSYQIDARSIAARLLKTEWELSEP